MELEGSLLCSQQLTTGPYLESDASSHNLPSCFPAIHSNIILPVYAQVFQVVSFLQVFLPKACIHSTSIKWNTRINMITK